jgi:hypothetical protein
VNQAEAGVIFRCDDGKDGCGISFVAKSSYAAKIRRGVHRQLCRRCARDALRTRPKEGPTRADLIFWLERFSDNEIASFVVVFFGAEFDPAPIARRREELLGADLPLVAAGGGG